MNQQDDRQIEFFVRPLRSGGERVLRGFENHHGRVVDSFCRDEANPRGWGRATFFAEHAEALRELVDVALGQGHPHGRFEHPGREITVRVTAAPGAITIQRRAHERDEDIGRPFSMAGEELHAFAAAVEWLAS